MKLQRWLAVTLAAVLSVSTCLPVSAIGTYASETDSTQEMAVEEAMGAAVPGREAGEEGGAVTAEEAADASQEGTGETGSGTDAGAADSVETGSGTDAGAEDSVETGNGTDAEVADFVESAEPAEAADPEMNAAPVSEGGEQEEAAAGETGNTDADAAEEDAINDAGAGEEDAAGAAYDTAAEGETGAAEIEEESGKEAVETPAVQATEDDFANAVELTAESPVQVEVSEEVPCAYLRFTPAKNAAFAFYSYSDEGYDTYAVLYDEAYAQIGSDDDNGEDHNFRLKQQLQAGHTYYLEVRQYSYEYAAFTVCVGELSFYVSREGDREVVALPGEEVTFSVTASSNAAINYQWYKDYEAVEGETGRQYTTVADYRHEIYCDVWDENGESDTVWFMLELENHFEAYPEGGEAGDTSLSKTVPYGTRTSLRISVTADDKSRLSYAWRMYDYADDGWEDLEGADSAALMTDPVRNKSEYECSVQDGYGNETCITFYIYIENHLKAWPEGNDEDDNDISTTIGPGKTKTLRVMVSADHTDGLTYQWGDSNLWEEYEGENSDTYTAGGGGDFACRVTDLYGNTAIAYFYLSVDNRLRAYPEGSEDGFAEILMDAGQEKRLKTIVTAEDMDGITFRWEKQEEEEDWAWTELEGENSDTLTTPVNTEGDWRCVVEDAYGNTQYAYFNVEIDNHLEIRQEGNDRILNGYRVIHLQPHEKTTLRAAATALEENSLQFSWEKDEEEIEGETKSTLEVSGEQTAEYICRVQDPYGSSGRVIFDVVIDNRLEAHPTGMHAGETRKEYDEPAKAGEVLSVNASAIDLSGVSYAWSYLERGSWEWNEIEGETGAEHTIRSEELTEGRPAAYQCDVRDPYGNRESVSFRFPSGDVAYTFTVYPENAGLRDDGNREDFAWVNSDTAQGEVTLRVIAETTDPSGLRYVWYDDDWTYLQDSTENQLTVSASGSSRYICEVGNGRGQWKTVYFYLRSNAFRAYPEGAENSRDDDIWIHLDMGETRTLKAVVLAEDMSGVTYQWQDEDADLKGETKPELSITGTAGKEYMCRISDGYGNSTTLYYYISVGSLTISPVVSGAEYEEYSSAVDLYMKPGARATLKCDVQGEKDAKLSYMWSDWSGDDSILGTDASLEVTADSNKMVELRVSDQYGNNAYLDFYFKLNHLQVSADQAGSSPTWKDWSGQKWYLAGEEGATLKVKAEADDTSSLLYRWYDGDRYALAATGTDTIVVNPGGKHSYYCEVEDQYRNVSTAYFSVLNDSGLTAFPADRSSTEYNETENRSTLYTEKGTALILKVDASVTDHSVLKYSWQSRNLRVTADGTVDEKAAGTVSGWKDLAGNTNSLAITADADERYHCLVEDIYGRQVIVSFDVRTTTIRDLSTAEVTFPKKSLTYNGKAQVQAPKVTLNGVTLVKDTDYTVAYSKNTNSGTAVVTVKGKGKYTGTATGSFTIVRAAQAITAKAAAAIDVGKTTKITASGAKETNKYTFTSSNTAVATVSANGTVTGKKAGTATITVSTPQTANYNKGTKTVKITVRLVLKKPGNCHFVKWNNAKYNSCQIAWNKSEGATGYQSILSWTDGSHASTKILKSNVLSQNCSVTVNHVSQFKVRAFADTANGRVYSPWSNLEYITPSPTRLNYKNASKGSALQANISWNIIYGCNGYNVFLTTNPNGTWYWNQSTDVKATSLSATITKYRGSKLKKNTRYYVRIVTRRKRNGVFCTVPMPAANTNIGSFVIK